ncbi:MAG: hypothetical protein ACI4EZ_00355, partial [Anaerostipes faecalis]
MRVSESPTDKFLDQESLQYLVSKIKEEIKKNGGTSGVEIDLSDYYTKSQIDDMVKELPSGSTGVGIASVSINDSGHLIVTLTDGTSTDLGNVVGRDGTNGKDGVDGTNGKDGVNGKDGTNGIDGKDGINGVDGKDGADGFSPQIVENAENTDTQYKLDITTSTGTFTTPNLKGQDGSAGSSGGGGATSEVYSTEETEIGTWINGEPIYQKVVPITFKKEASSGSVTSEAFNVGTTISALVDLKAIRAEPQYMLMSTTHIINTSISGITSFSDFKNAILSMSLTNDGTLFVYHGSKYNGWSFNIILKYELNENVNSTCKLKFHTED